MTGMVIIKIECPSNDYINLLLFNNKKRNWFVISRKKEDRFWVKLNIQILLTKNKAFIITKSNRMMKFYIGYTILLRK